MSEPESSVLKLILQECARAAPQPWYPSAYARATGVSRDSLDPSLDQLRLAGLVRLTDWVQGQGQGYTLTDAGVNVVGNPRRLAQLRQGRLPTTNGLTAVRPRRTDKVATPWERGEAAREALLHPTVPWVTFSLIGINALWFLAGFVLAGRMAIPAEKYVWPSGAPPQYDVLLIRTGAMESALFFLMHQWWRLLSCAFVHIGIVHLGVNMLSLYWVGPFLEQIWGHVRYLFLYLVAIIGGSCGMLIEGILARHDMLAAGASGAIWGIFASLATWLFLNRRALPPPIVVNLTRVLLINFVLNLFVTFGFAGISKGGHFGGGIAGILVAVPLDYLLFVRGWRRVLCVTGVLAVPIVSLALTFGLLYGSAGARSPDTAANTSLTDEGAEFNRINPQAVKIWRRAKKLTEQRHIDPSEAVATQKQIDGMRQELSALSQRLANSVSSVPKVQQLTGVLAAYLRQFERVLKLYSQAVPLAAKDPDDEAIMRQRDKLDDQISDAEDELGKLMGQWHELDESLRPDKKH